MAEMLVACLAAYSAERSEFLRAALLELSTAEKMDAVVVDVLAEM